MKLSACSKAKLWFIFTIVFISNTVPGVQAKSEDHVFSGSQTCRPCHAEEYRKWLGSHHYQAMQMANEQSVLGKFANTKFKHQGIETLFYRQNKRFMVRTDGPEGRLHDYEIKYTFGFSPLQQYLIEFDNGRLQVLDIAWDSRPAEQGGQRWMHLHPEEKIRPDDVLHWTGPNLNWNYMCADCHSTGFEKHYDAKQSSYQSRYAEINVACEACHGPGQTHIEWAKQTPEQKKHPNKGLAVIFDERDNVFWRSDKGSGKPQRSKPNLTDKELNACAACHSRRSQIAINQTGQPLMDAYIPALLTTGLYDADGHIADEVFVYGSFLQSKMHQAGVMCSDCHDSHSTALRHPGQQVCYQCHSPKVYAQTSHHFHAPQSPGASCIECHMPPETYMQVDARHDHSFRVPRPDWSMTLGTKNACNVCHSDKSALWAANRIKQWYGKTPVGFQQFAESFDAARRQHPSASGLLLQMLQAPDQTAIVKATALDELTLFPSPGAFQAAMAALQDDDPIVRRAALTALAGYDPSLYLKWVAPLLSDPVLSVRLEAIQLLAAVNTNELGEAERLAYQKAVQEFIQAQLFNAERPESQVNLANFYAVQGRETDAHTAYDQAIKLQPQFVPAYANKAQLLSQQHQEEQAQDLLRKGLKAVPQQADLAEALGLSLIRQKQNEKALPWLENAMNWDQNNVRYAYVYAVALHSGGASDKAIEVLQTTLKAHPDNPDVLYALVTFNRDKGDTYSALAYLDRLLEQVPENPGLVQLRQELLSR